MLGQPGEDVFFGNGGDDVIDARGRSTGRALIDPFDPGPVRCEIVKNGEPVPGLNG